MLWTKRVWGGLAELRAKSQADSSSLSAWLDFESPWNHTSACVWGRLQFQQGEVPLSVWAFSTCDLGLWVECGGENELDTSIQSSLVSHYKVNVTSALGFHAMTSPMMYCTSDWAKVNPPFFRKVFCQTVRKVANTQSASFPTPTRSCNF